MAFDFPSNPPVGTIVTGPNGIQYRYDGTKWMATPLPDLYAPVNSPVFTGDPQAPTAPVGDADQSIASTQFVTRAVAPAFNDVGRNYLHNGLFNIQQRGAGPFATLNTYTADRWFLQGALDTASISIAAMGDSNRAQIGDEAATYFLQNIFTGNSGATAYNAVAQRIENVRRLSGKTVTASFWAAPSTVGMKLGVGMYQYFGTGGSPSPGVGIPGQAVTLSANMARYSVTFSVPSIAGMTLGTNGDNFTHLVFYFSSGANNANSAGSIGVQSGTVWLWGVQLEIGSAATPLEKLDPQQDLAKCQRFYQTGNANNTGYGVAGTGIAQAWALPVLMRAAPTVTPSFSNANINSPVLGAFSPGYLNVAGTAAATGNYSLSGGFTASADL